MIRRISVVIMVSIPVFITIWDIFAAIAGHDATFSVILASVLRKSPMIPFSLGLLTGTIIGHIFWPVRLQSKIK